MTDALFKPKVSELDLAQRRLRSLENEIVAEASEVVASAMQFSKVTCEKGERPPQEWIDELGEEKAMQRLRVAQSAWMSAKDSPVALKMAQAVLVGSIKANATREAAPRSLNVALVSIAAPVSFPEKELEHE